MGRVTTRVQFDSKQVLNLIHGISQIQLAAFAASPVRVERFRGDRMLFVMTISQRQ